MGMGVGCWAVSTVINRYRKVRLAPMSPGGKNCILKVKCERHFWQPEVVRAM